MNATITRRIVIGVILAAVLAVWITTKTSSTKHYTDAPGQGAALERMVLPKLDDSPGGAVPPVDPGTGTPAVHYPAQQVAVDRPPAAPPAVAAGRAPDATPQDPQLGRNPQTGGDVHDPMPGTASFDASIITSHIPLCDAACVQRVIDQLGLPPVVPPVVPPVIPPVGTPLN